MIIVSERRWRLVTERCSRRLEDAPAPIESSELVLAATFEPQFRPGDEVDHELRDEDLRGGRHPAHALCDVHTHSEDIAAAPLDLAGVYSGTDGQSSVSSLVFDRKGALHGARRCVEHRVRSGCR